MPTPTSDHQHEIVFHIDQEEFHATTDRFTVRTLLADYAKEDPNTSILAERQGNATVRHENLDELLVVKSGTHFIVLHNKPTPVSDFGPQRLVDDLRALGHASVETMTDAGGIVYAIIRGFVVPAGGFAGRQIDLGIPAPPSFPNAFGSALHVRAIPQLLPLENVPNVHNVAASPLGPEWHYWSHNFSAGGVGTTRRLMSQINRVLSDA
ncbi:MAG: hypothetical protein ABJE95_00725 [Byssovorax sp.]